MRLMKGMRQSIKEGTFPKFVSNFMSKMYEDGQYPVWVVEALAAVNIRLQHKQQDVDNHSPNKKPFTHTPCQSSSS